MDYKKIRHFVMSHEITMAMEELITQHLSECHVQKGVVSHTLNFPINNAQRTGRFKCLHPCHNRQIRFCGGHKSLPWVVCPVCGDPLSGKYDGYYYEECYDEYIYPCIKCGKMRTKSEGGDTFSLCDTCWEFQTKRMEGGNKKV